MIFFRILGYLVLVLLFGYSFLRYYHLWSRLGIKGTTGRMSRSLCIYLVIQVVLSVILLICRYRTSWILWEPLLCGMQAVSCVYLSILLYSPVLCFIRGMIRFLGKHKKKKGRIYRFFNHPARSIYVILGFTACIGIVSFLQAGYLRVQEYDLTISKTAEKESMSMVVISDLHLGSSMTRHRLKEMILQINDRSPDVIVFCGDTLDANTSGRWKDDGAVMLSELRAEYGVFCIEGNHEARCKEEYAEWADEAGIVLLRDQGVSLVNGIQMVGLCDPQDPDKRDVGEVMAVLDQKKPILVLSHRPEQLQKISESGADLVLCGHIGGESYPLEDLFQRSAADLLYGEKKIGNMSAVTTSGVGRFGIPARLISPSEILSVRLRFT